MSHSEALKVALAGLGCSQEAVCGPRTKLDLGEEAPCKSGKRYVMLGVEWAEVAAASCKYGTIA